MMTDTLAVVGNFVRSNRIDTYSLCFFNFGHWKLHFSSAADIDMIWNKVSKQITYICITQKIYREQSAKHQLETEARKMSND